MRLQHFLIMFYIHRNSFGHIGLFQLAAVATNNIDDDDELIWEGERKERVSNGDERAEGNVGARNISN